MTENMKKSTRRRCFSLLEIMVVVVLIGIIASMGIKGLIGTGEGARVTLTQTTLSGVAEALQLFRLTNNRYPSNEEGLEILYTGESAQLNQKPVDAWNHDIQYNYPGNNGPFDLYSPGADGLDGGDGFNADIFFNFGKKE